MAKKRSRSFLVGSISTALILFAPPTWLNPGYVGAQQVSETTSGDSDASQISEAERHFRLGVALFRDGNYREALDEFNRALALDPTMEEALDFRRQCEAKLETSASGEDPSAITVFETFDPEAIGTIDESPQLSPEEHKIQTVRELVEKGELWLEYDYYKEAVQYFEQAILIAPDNLRALDGLHKATLGRYNQQIEDTQKKLKEQTSLIRTFIEESKLLPEGMTASGIRNPRINIPTIEEKMDETEEESKIEGLLRDSTVSIVFEDIHLRDIFEFISDTYDVNIMIDNRVVAPEDTESAGGAGPGAFPGGPQFQPGGGGGGGGGLGIGGGIGGAPGGPQGGGPTALGGEYVTDGMVPYITLKDVSLRDALRAILRPLNLDFSIQPAFIWISTAEKIRTETFEDLDTRYYQLKNAGAETLFKVVMINFPATTGGGGGGQGQGGGGQGGGGGGGFQGGGQGGGGGGGFQGGGGQGGGGGGGFQGGGGGGQGGGGGFQGGGGGGQGQGGGGQGGGGQGGGFGGINVSNISQLFQTFNDLQVGERPNAIVSGAGGGGGGGGGGAGVGGFAGGGAQAAQPGALGETAAIPGEPQIMFILRNIIPNIIEPLTGRTISFMHYNLITNQLIVHNTPTNLELLENQLEDLDLTPKQVNIEAKFLTINITDLKRRGFDWNFTASDLNNRPRVIDGIATDTFPFDINGDGSLNQIPIFRNPDGSNLIGNTVSTAELMTSIIPGLPEGVSETGFKLTGMITNNRDGSSLSVTFDYLNSLEESELLSAPRVTTMNQKPAMLMDIRTEYFASSVFNSVNTIAGGFGGNAQTVISSFVQPQGFNFGITLSVTPQISNEDQIRLWLNPQVTTRVGFDVFENNLQTLDGSGNVITVPSTFTLPQVSIQSVWTNVIVNNGDTLVLGGFIKDESFSNEQKMPFLADIPLIGNLFRSKQKQIKQSSLMIFVTPTIVDTTGASYFESGSIRP